MKINIINTLENLGVAALTLLVINFFIIKPMRIDFNKRLDKQDKLIKELATLEKYQIENNFDKLKSHKGEIILDLNNDMTVVDIDTTITEISEDTVKVGFFKRLFGGK